MYLYGTGEDSGVMLDALGGPREAPGRTGEAARVIIEAPGETGVTKNHNKGSWTPREDPEVMLETHWGQDRVLQSC